jgi:hypothetical protein
MCIWKYVEHSCILCVDLVDGRQSARLRRNHKVIVPYIIWRFKRNRGAWGGVVVKALRY